MLGGLYWRGGNRVGALVGISAGFVLWLYTQVVPIFVEAGFLAPALLRQGPGGLGWLRPRALLRPRGLDPPAHGTLWRLGAHVLAYRVVSLGHPPRALA